MNTWDTHKGYVDSKNLTKLLDILPIETFSKSLIEIIDNKELFTPHVNSDVYLKSGPLRECKSIFLKKDLKILPQTIALFLCLKKLVDNGMPVRKAYVTIVKPGGKIYEHCDNDSYYWSIVDRYQFYLTGNADCIQIIKKEKFKIAPGYFYFFDHKQIHYYENNSNEDLILMVFDIQRKDINVL
jgi:aspartyl/asparaginyl beta-hydroxylase (cupin superfamily)